MIVGISIDGVLRNFFGQIEKVHSKYFGSEDDELITVEDYDLDKWVTFPEEEVKQAELEFDPNFKEDSFLESDESVGLVKQTKKVTLEEFLYEKCTLEIFGYANETISSAVETLNQLILEHPNHEFVIISREGGLAIPSTLFFLSKTKSICTNIKFIKEYSNVWDLVDVMITDNPDILKSKPNNKLSVIVDKHYNEDINQSGIRVKTIKEVDLRVLDGLHETLIKGVN
jgi:hypothetical protein